VCCHIRGNFGTAKKKKMSGKPYKGYLGKIDIIPISYWLRRYASNSIKMLVFRIITLETYSVLSAIAAFVSLPHFSVWQFLLYYLIARVSFLALYEIGYFVNDFWSEKREAARSGRPFQHSKPDIGILLGAIFSRLCAVSALTLLLYCLYGKSVLPGFLSILLFAQIVFMAHNWLFVPHRIITFAILSLCQYLIPVPYITNAGYLNKAVILYTLLVIPMVIGYCVQYAAHKCKLGKCKYLDFSFGYFNKCYGNSILRIAMAILELEIILAAAFLRYEAVIIMLVTLCFLFCLDVLYVSGRFLSSLRSALQERFLLYHIHTNFSHDSTNTFEQIIALCKRKHIPEVYINDHAEDFDTAKYDRLKAVCIENSNKVKLHCGLEYEILGQHFLCNNLQTYIRIENSSPDEIAKLKNCCSEVIWAHPHFKIRKFLFDSDYRKTWYEMMRYVDGMEIINYKGLRRKHYAWRYVFLSFLGCFCKNMKLTSGTDAHTLEDLTALKKNCR
jgi:hypothetical protein